MKKHHVVLSCLVVSLTAMMMFVSCATDNSSAPTAPADSAADLGNYAHMSSGSTVVGGQQYNWMISSGSFMYGQWFYAEVNQQNGAGLEPGDGQVNVQMTDVQFVFTGLPSDVRVCQDSCQLIRYTPCPGSQS